MRTAPLDEFGQTVYCSEVLQQCRFALNAVAQINDGVRRPRDSSAHTIIFRGLPSLLSHASNVSQLLWPTQPRKKEGESREDYKTRCATVKERGDSLRRLLCVPDDSPLKARALRNHLEHFDERLDEWKATSKRQNLVSDYIGPPGEIAGIDTSDRMREYDPTTGIFSFRGEVFRILELADAVAELTPKAEKMASPPWIRNA